MLNVKSFALIMIAVIVSFMGFCVENIFTAFTHGFLSNKNMVLPFLWGYGLAILVLYLLFGTPQNPLFFGKKIHLVGKWRKYLYYFTVAFLGVSIGEIALGFATEKICNIIWWDYSIIPLHITRYTSVPTSCGFSFLIMIFMRYFFNPLLNYFSSMNPQALRVLALSLAFMLSVDMINSALYMMNHNNTLQIWRIDVKQQLHNILADIFP